ncbi:MAG: hypothetical protein NZ108_06735, partial [Bacteroidia bacterium]|nr:hypothetical protein [Bacteroidia bacterium]
DGGIRMRKTYRYFQRYFGSNGTYDPDGSITASLGNWDFCAIAHYGIKNNGSNIDEDDDSQCAVYPNTGGAGTAETTNYDVTYVHAYNSRPEWIMYLEKYEDTSVTTCAANCINLE